MDHLRINLDGLEFHALAAGPEEGHLVVLAHGFPDSSTTWVDLLDALGSAGHRAVALSMRGYAPSGIPLDSPSEPARLALDLLGVADNLRPDEHCSIIGHDWGAIAAYGATQIAPERVDHLVAMAVPPMPAVLQAMQDPAQLERSWYLFAFQEEGYEASVRQDDFKLIRDLWTTWSPSLPPGEDLEAAIEAIRDPLRTTAVLDYYRAMLDPTRRDPRIAWAAAKLEEPLSVPTLYLHGRLDGCMGLDSIGAVEGLLPEGSIVEIFEDAGHFLHLEEPERTAELVLSFLGPSGQPKA